MIFGLLDWLKIGVGAVVGAIIGYGIGHWQGHDAGYQKLASETALEAAKAEKERRGDDAKLQSMSDYDLCVAGLRGSRLSVSSCDVLRGNGKE